jgi:hypothetical protein
LNRRRRRRRSRGRRNRRRRRRKKEVGPGCLDCTQSVPPVENTRVP